MCKSPNADADYDSDSYGDYSLISDAIVASLTSFKTYMGEMSTKLKTLKNTHL